MCKDKDRQPSRGIVDTTDTSLCINPISYPISKIENQSGIPRKLLQLTTWWIDKQLIWEEGLVIVIKYSMKAPWLQRISAGVSWFSEGQASKAQDCENTEARGHHQPAPTITSALYNFRKTYQIYTLCPFPRLLQGQLQPPPPDTARCRFKQNAKRKAPAGAPCVAGLSFYDWDAVAMMLPKLYWSNLAFLGRTYVFILQSREEASKVDDDKNLCFLLCFKALTDIINSNWRQN